MQPLLQEGWILVCPAEGNRRAGGQPRPAGARKEVRQPPPHTHSGSRPDLRETSPIDGAEIDGLNPPCTGAAGAGTVGRRFVFGRRPGSMQIRLEIRVRLVREFRGPTLPQPPPAQGSVLGLGSSSTAPGGSAALSASEGASRRFLLPRGSASFSIPCLNGF